VELKELTIDKVRSLLERGDASAGIDGVREVEIEPGVEIRSHHVSGDLESSTFTTHVVEVNGIPHIINRGRYVPKAWIPPLIGPAVIEGQTRKQFEDIGVEPVVTSPSGLSSELMQQAAFWGPLIQRVGVTLD
jgi:hypothetical protein